MKVFISWSGEYSGAIADALRTWIPSVLQKITPYFTPTDTEKGSRWASEIAGELEASEFGIICLTPDNLSSGWILFEAGAISKSVSKGRLYPLLFGLDPSDLKDPLAQFNAASFGRTEFRKVVSAINDALGEDKLKDDVFSKVFDMWWPELEKLISDIRERSKADEGLKEIRTDRELVEEILNTVRTISRTSAALPNLEPEMGKLVSALDQLIATLEIFEPNRLLAKETFTVVRRLGNFVSELPHETGARESLKDLSEIYKRLEKLIRALEKSEAPEEDDIPF